MQKFGGANFLFLPSKNQIYRMIYSFCCSFLPADLKEAVAKLKREKFSPVVKTCYRSLLELLYRLCVWVQSSILSMLLNFI